MIYYYEDIKRYVRRKMEENSPVTETLSDDIIGDAIVYTLEFLDAEELLMEEIL